MSKEEITQHPVDGKRGVPRLDTLYFYIGGCNLRCLHCWVDPGYQRSEDVYSYALDFALFRSIVEQAIPLGLRDLKLTGGEPLVHPEIREMLQFVQGQDVGLVVETNGTLLTPEIAKLIVSCKDPFVSVSLDSVEADVHEWMRNVPGCFEKTIDGIRTIVDAGLKPQIIMSVMSRNKHQLEDLVGFAESLGADSVKFNLISRTSRGELLQQRGETLSIEEYVELGEWVERTLRPSSNISVRYSHPSAFVPYSNLLGPDGDPSGSCGIIGILGVLSDGSYALCGIGEAEPDLVFGNAAKTPLADVWENAPFLLELREKFPQALGGVCARCVVRGRCLGHCIASNYHTSRDIWAGYWYCNQAYEKGLFPAKRLMPASEGVDRGDPRSTISHEGR